MTMLEVRNVTKRFGNLVAVKDVSMSVKPGELRAIIGPNGAGKTTFFNMISGYFAPTSGLDPVRRTGRDPGPGAPAGRARHGTHLPDHGDLSRADRPRKRADGGRGGGGTDVAYGAEPGRAKLANDVAAEMLALVGLTGKADRLVGELAHGDQRTTEIAMALAQTPRLLLLDEPTAGMGDQETYEITALIRRLHRDSNYTIVLIEHDMRVVFHLADYITVLDQGNLLAEGTPKEIAASEAVQAAYLGEAG